MVQDEERIILPSLLTVSCPALNAPADGRKFGSKYLVDHEVHFACNPGFRLVGPSSVVCLPNGTWTGEQPRCRGTVSPSHPTALDPSQHSKGLLHRKGHCLEYFLLGSLIIPQPQNSSQCARSLTSMPGWRWYLSVGAHCIFIII